MVPGRSFEGLFTDSNIAYRAPDKSPTTLYASLRNSISVTGWPAWRTLSLDYESKPYVRDFTLTMNSGTRGYRPDQINAQSKFSEAATLINEIKNTIRLTDERVPGLYAQFTSESMAMVVFGSNAQELAGLGRGQTYKLCMRIFNGEEVDPAHIEERSEDYAASALFLRSQRGLEKPDIDDVVRSRREVIQHAQALKFITDTALNRDRPLTETLIKETHRTLCGGLPHPNGGPTEWRDSIEMYPFAPEQHNSVHQKKSHLAWQPSSSLSTTTFETGKLPGTLTPSISLPMFVRTW